VRAHEEVGEEGDVTSQDARGKAGNDALLLGDVGLAAGKDVRKIGGEGGAQAGLTCREAPHHSRWR
jgi:hypothetical protein